MKNIFTLYQQSLIQEITTIYKNTDKTLQSEISLISLCFSEILIKSSTSSFP